MYVDQLFFTTTDNLLKVFRIRYIFIFFLKALAPPGICHTKLPHFHIALIWVS